MAVPLIPRAFTTVLLVTGGLVVGLGEGGWQGSASVAEALERVHLRVHDAESGDALPGKLTLIGADGVPAQVVAAEVATPVRAGVVYVPAEGAEVLLPAGEYRVWATRGLEWSAESTTCRVGPGRNAVDLGLTRQVDTRGFLAVDTHMHTGTYGDHGDARIEERVLTVAGEGLDVAVATDHDHATDYAPVQQAAGLQPDFTAITGAEVTTEFGHFSAFPLQPGGALPDPALRGWPALVSGARAAGASVVVLNHPHWPLVDGVAGPFDTLRLDPLTGARDGGAPFTFDALEVVNASDAQADPLLLFRDWFALLNRGERIAAVASSDSHNVVDPAGQARTYVRSPTDDGAEADVGELCAAIKAGRSSVSFGIFVEATLNGRGLPGDVVAPRRGPDGREGYTLVLRTAAPAWVRPRLARLFVNGEELATASIAAADAGQPLDAEQVFVLPPLPHDAWLVAIVTGDAVAAPFWPSVNPYTLAATNAFFLDADGDGLWRSPRETAKARLELRERAGRRLDVPEALDGLDTAAAAQWLEIVTGLRGSAVARQAGGPRAVGDARIAALLDRLDG